MEKIKIVTKGGIYCSILIKFELSLKNFNVKCAFQKSMDMTGVCVCVCGFLNELLSGQIPVYLISHQHEHVICTE